MDTLNNKPRLIKILVLSSWGVLLCLLSSLAHQSLTHSENTPAVYEQINLNIISNKMESTPAPTFTLSTGQQLASFVKKTISTMRYSAYKLGGSRFDIAKGIYVLDCSSYVDQMLHTVSPRAYSSLVDSTGTNRPNSKNYYDFFTHLSEKPKQYWNKIKSVNQLQPGDILVFCYKQLHPGKAAGHVMIIIDKPVQSKEGYLVNVADSAVAAHSQDTRHSNGVGIGTMALKVDPETGQPVAYAWKKNSNWKNNVKFAMGRPTEKVFNA